MLSAKSIEVPLALGALLLAFASPALGEPIAVERVGPEMFRVAAKGYYLRTDSCDEAPARSAAELRKSGAVVRITFPGNDQGCAVRDFLVPVDVFWDEYRVLLTQEPGGNWYRVTESDYYLKTAGCFGRTLSEPAIVDIRRDGTGMVRFDDLRRCSVEHAFRRVDP